MSEALAFEAAATLWRLADDEGLFQRLVDFFKKKENIVILGSTGSGKSNLLTSLAAAAGLVQPISNADRTQASKGYTVRLDKNLFRAIDTPGQTHHSADRLRTIREVMANPPVRVMNVVSYGYHEYAAAAGEALTSTGVSESFLQRHRDNELTALNEWLPLLGDRTVTRWIFTVVTKADLWWDKYDEVLEYYQIGPYAEKLRGVDSRLRVATLPYCSVVHRFFGTAKHAGSFDDEDRMRTNKHFLHQLVDLD